MLRGRFLKTPLVGKNPFGDSRRWGDFSVLLRTKLLESGSGERLRQKESRGNWPLVVAAETGLTAGVGVTASISGVTGGSGSQGRSGENVGGLSGGVNSSLGICRLRCMQDGWWLRWVDF